MVEQIIASHCLLVYIFLGFLVAGILVPLLTAKNPLGFRKVSFIYTMVFQGIITMVAFTGLVGMVMGEMSLNLSISLMSIIWVVLMYIEIRKYRLIKISQIQQSQTHQLLKGAFFKISVLQMLLVFIMIVLMLLKSKGIVVL